MFQARFRQYRNVWTFDLPEDEQIGPDVTLETALEARGIPLHPGAERFYKEAGLIK